VRIYLSSAILHECDFFGFLTTGCIAMETVV